MTQLVCDPSSHLNMFSQYKQAMVLLFAWFLHCFMLTTWYIMVNEPSGVQFVYWNHTCDFKITSMISNQNWNFITAILKLQNSVSTKNLYIWPSSRFVEKQKQKGIYISFCIWQQKWCDTEQKWCDLKQKWFHLELEWHDLGQMWFSAKIVWLVNKSHC